MSDSSRIGVDGCLERATSIPTGSEQTSGPRLPYNAPCSYNNPIASSSSSATPPSHLDMRPFSVKGLFGLNVALTTGGPSFSFPTSAARVDRAHSEPLLPVRDEDVEMGSPLPRYHSEYVIRLRQEDLSVSNNDTQFLQEEPASHPPRPVSPAATEIEDPEPQDIVADIQQKGIKVRDFAYATPALPVTEMFDQYTALTEIEYRWSQIERKHPVSGKTLRRLLDIGWLTREEIAARAAPMDLEELRKHDARPQHPWKPFRLILCPTLEERRMMLDMKRGFWRQMDRILAQAEREEQRQKWHAEDMAKAAEEMEEILAARTQKGKARGDFCGPSSPTGIKRRLLDLDEHEGERNTRNTAGDDPFLDTGSESKRRRISPEPDAYESQWQDSYPPLVPPIKQYPAPLHSYDPVLYPEAASIIEASSQSQSQPRPIVAPPLERSDTPPLEKEESTEQWSPGKGAKLVHPKKNGLKRALGRTQTFAQL